MDGNTERQLVRLVTKESGPQEAARLRERLAREPSLREAFERLEQSWGALAAPPAPIVPQGFTSRVLARARAEAPATAVGWGLAPLWLRAAALALAVAGAALGSDLTSRLGAEAAPDDAPALDLAGGASLAETYFATFDDREPGDGQGAPENVR